MSALFAGKRYTEPTFSSLFGRLAPRSERFMEIMDFPRFPSVTAVDQTVWELLCSVEELGKRALFDFGVARRKTGVSRRIMDLLLILCLLIETLETS